MDVRINKVKTGVAQLIDEQDSKLTDSLIFNVIKKLQLKMTMQNMYEDERTPQLAKISNYFGRNIHSTAALAYLGLVMSTMVVLRYKGRTRLRFGIFVPHLVIALTINEFERYRNIMNIDSDLREEYRTYQRNAADILAEKRRRMNLFEQIKKSNVISFAKMLEMLKFRHVY